METLLIAGGLASTGATGTLFSSAALATTVSALPAFSSVLGVGLTGASMLGQMSAGSQQAATLNAQARQAELSARMELLRGREQSMMLAEQRDKDLASANALFGARGVTTSEGSAEAAMNEARRVASTDIQRTIFGAQMSSAQQMTTAQSYRSDASAARTSGFTGAFTSAAGSRFGGGLLEKL